MNDHAPAIFVDGNMVYHFNLTATWKGSVVRTSTDNGYTWTQFRPYCQEDPAGQPNESIIKTHDGRFLGTLDGPNETSEVVESRDHGNTWKMLTRLDDREHDTPGATGRPLRESIPLWRSWATATCWHLAAWTTQDGSRCTTIGCRRVCRWMEARPGLTASANSPPITSGQRMTMKRLK